MGRQFAAHDEALMLFSPSRRVAFAHYTKTAGSSLTNWFMAAFPDAVPACTGFPHTPVPRGLELLGVAHRPRWAALRLLERSFPARVYPATLTSPPMCILGVIREPFEMLVSLYEYWRRHPSPGRSSFIRTAQRGSFSEFLTVGFRRRKIVAYERFFDVGGPAWPQTRLVAFDALEAGLREVCREFSIDTPPQLERINAASRSQRPLDDYAAEAGPLVDRIRKHFAWYYERGIHLARRGAAEDAPALRRAA